MIPFNPLLIKIGVLVALIAGAYVKGCSDEKERFDQYKVAVAAVGQAQEARTKAWIVEGKRNKEKADADYDRVVESLLTELERANKRLRDATARSSLVSPARSVAEGGDGDTVCFSQRVLSDELRGVMERFLGRNQNLVREGEKARAALQACVTWAVKNAER